MVVGFVFLECYVFAWSVASNSEIILILNIYGLHENLGYPIGALNGVGFGASNISP